MFLDRISAAGANAQLIAENALAVQQWEIVLAEEAGFGPGATWPSLKLSSFSRWLSEHWEATRAAEQAEHDLSLLSPIQSEWLWRRVIDESGEGASLISPVGMARLARETRRCLFDHGIDPGALDAETWSGDAASFLRWNSSYDAELKRHGWLDSDSLLYRLNRRSQPQAPVPLVWLDPGQWVPERHRLEQRWRALGGASEIVSPAAQQASPTGMLAAEPGAELEQVIDWAARLLRRDPARRLAVVLPDLSARLLEVETAFSEAVGPSHVSLVCDRSLRDVGVFGAALAAFAVLTPGSGFAPLSRLLRSPFFGVDGDDMDSAEREALERWLRGDPRASTDFLDHYRRFGLRRECERRAPGFARRLNLALEQLPQRASPSAWSQALQGALRALAWHGFEPGIPDELVKAWDAAWSSFAELTPILGTLALPQALADFDRILARQAIYRPLRLHGVHVLSRIDQIGPGYAGAWITGFSDRNWPENRELNPLIPWSLKHRCEMPGALPARDYALARQSLERLAARVPEIVFSCPQQILDQPQLPNAWIEAWAPAAAAEPLGARSGALASATRRDWETVVDEAPPLRGDRIHGGPRTLDLQSHDPVVAFAAARLRAEPLRPPVRGIDARLRGLVVHRVLELLGAADGAPSDAVARVLAELPSGNAIWQAQLEAERERIAAQLASLLELESRRAPFTIEATEQRFEIQLAGRRLRCRIDRVDRLRSGARLLIDYKTGKGRPAAWFKDRLGDCQLPLYAQHFGEAVGGVAVVSLSAEGAAFRAAGVCVDELPGKHRQFGDDAWHEQLRRWRSQLEALAAEFVNGDVRVNTEASSRESSDYAGLTRIRERGR